MAAAANANTLRLEIIGATGLVETGRIKKQDPYVEVHVNDNVVRKSKTHSRAGSDPVWDEEIDFELPGAASEIKFIIKDKNILVSDNIIGISTLDLNRSSGTGVETLPVFSQNGEPAGQLKIRVISGGRQTRTQRGTGAGTGAAAADAGAGAGLAGAAGRHGVTGTGTGTHTATGATRDLHEGQAAGVGAGLGSAATSGRTGAHGTATTGLESDMANKARIGGTGTGMGAGAAGAGVGAGMAGAGAERREERQERREERREERGMAMSTGAGAGMGAGMAAGAHAGTGRGAPGFTGEMTNLSGQSGTVCDQKFFTVEEDRPIVKEVKQFVREHHPVEREMVHETKTTGRERGMGGGPAELVDTKERIVENTVPKPCP